MNSRFQFQWASAIISAIALIFLFLAFEFAPLWINRNDSYPDKSQHKCNPEINNIDDPRKTLRPNNDIKIIRLTNSGEFVSRCELTNALYELNWDRKFPFLAYGPDIKENAKSLPKLTVLYIHGWKHSAESSDTDLKNFGELIGDLRRNYGDTKRVVGIYVGWNANTDIWKWAEILENLTFWVKKNNADRISQSAAVTMIVSAVGVITKSEPDRRDQFIAIGHSFGARLLYAASAQSLISATQKAHPGYPMGTYSHIEGVADAIILLNPAFEASRYSVIDDYRRNDEHFLPSQKPLMITVASEADRATEIAFPMGQWLGLARSERELTTLGNYAAFQTHTLDRISQAECEKNDYIGELCLRMTPPKSEQEKLLPGGAIQQRNPFMVIRTQKSVISDHNDIWNSVFRKWLTAIIEIIQVEHADLPSRAPPPKPMGIIR